jgi:hypothetical protein
VKKLKGFACFLFAWFYDTQTQFRSYGIETGKMILVNLGCYKPKATQGVKPHHLLQLRDAYTTIIQIHLVASLIMQG